MVRIEGFSIDELLALPEGELDAFVFSGRPVVARVGSAEVLIECRRVAEILAIDLAHIDGGGEGVLPAVMRFAERFAGNRDFLSIEWIVRATRCANPNPKLRRVLVRKGFVVHDHRDFGECYYKKTIVPSRTV